MKDNDYNPMKNVKCGDCIHYDSIKSSCHKYTALHGGHMQVPFNSFCGGGVKREGKPVIKG